MALRNIRKRTIKQKRTVKRSHKRRTRKTRKTRKRVLKTRKTRKRTRKTRKTRKRRTVKRLGGFGGDTGVRKRHTRPLRPRSRASITDADKDEVECIRFLIDNGLFDEKDNKSIRLQLCKLHMGSEVKDSLDRQMLW